MKHIGIPTKEEPRARQPTRNLFPLESGTSRPIALGRLWEVLRPEDRRQTLQVLRRIVAQQIQLPPNIEEVRHEDC
jgi:hypothetical protein